MTTKQTSAAARDLNESSKQITGLVKLTLHLTVCVFLKVANKM